MSLITLITDFGTKDHSVAAIKGTILGEIPKVNVVDITHEISPFHIQECAYILKNAYNFFPKNSIHIIGVEGELTPENKHIVVKLDSHYFIGADNGVLSLILKEYQPSLIYEITLPTNSNTSFAEVDVFAKVACHIYRDGALSLVGKPIDKIKTFQSLEPVQKTDNKIICNVIYIDNYGNVILNVTKSFFEEFSKGRSFVINARGIEFTKIYRSYSDAINFDLQGAKREEDGKHLALFNSSGYLELSVYKSNPKTYGAANSLFGLKYRDAISITFD